jgi:hypothetical protein
MTQGNRTKGPRPWTRGPRKLRSTTADLILNFIRNLGPAPARFIADYCELDPHKVHTRCSQLAKSGHLERWVYDGWTFYGLPGSAPQFETLGYAATQRRRHGPRSKHQEF